LSAGIFPKFIGGKLEIGLFALSTKTVFEFVRYGEMFSVIEYVLLSYKIFLLVEVFLNPTIITVTPALNEALFAHLKEL
jgi:hypothetical protein